jgi:Bacterial Ig-like domain
MIRNSGPGMPDAVLPLPRLMLYGALALLAACGSESAPPRPGVASTTPAANAGDVETGAAVTVTFSDPIDPATLTPASFGVKRAGIPLSGSITYDGASHTATATVPLLPGVTYEAEVTTAVRTLGGTPITPALSWSFTTRAWQGATADPTWSGAFPSIALDAGGRLHATDYDDLHGDLRYTTCNAGCGSAAGWQSVAVDTSGDRGAFNSLVVEPGGRVHVAYYDQTADNLRYATCASDCAAPANWQTGMIDSSGGMGPGVSLVRDAGGRLHATYYDAVGDDLRYATCGGSCQSQANWETATVDSGGDVGQYTSLAVDGAGRLHVSYYDNGSVDLRYATCGGGCTVAANWQTVTVDAAGEVGFFPSLVVQGTRVDIAYYDLGNQDLKYATCASDCSVAGNWQATTVDGAGSVGAEPSLRLDAAGRAHLLYYDNDGNALRYATCATACGSAANWQTIRADPAAAGGSYSSLTVDGAGRLHLVYYSSAASLRYLE